MMIVYRKIIFDYSKRGMFERGVPVFISFGRLNFLNDRTEKSQEMHAIFWQRSLFSKVVFGVALTCLRYFDLQNQINMR